jgi:hypothetical protein
MGRARDARRLFVPVKESTRHPLLAEVTSTQFTPQRDLEFSPLQQNQAFSDMLAVEESKVANEKDSTP